MVSELCIDSFVKCQIPQRLPPQRYTYWLEHVLNSVGTIPSCVCINELVKIILFGVGCVGFNIY